MSTAFLYTNNELDFETKNTVPFILVPKKKILNKKVHINLTTYKIYIRKTIKL